MTCPQCGVDLGALRRGLSDPWAVNRRHCRQALARHALQCGGESEETNCLVQLLINAGEANRDWARRHLLPTYNVAGVEFSQN